MPRDERTDTFWIIGFDLRVWTADVGGSKQSGPISIDPNVWPSAREVAHDLLCAAYGVEQIIEVSNGLNLAITPPQTPAPTGFVWAGFDAPSEIVSRVSDSFGMQHSINSTSAGLSSAEFTRLGFDVVDIWTQRTALHPSATFEATLKSAELQLNKFGLHESAAAAAQSCRLADSRSPGSAPFQVVGVWIKS